ncbi:MAG: 50S ribosomal protein L30 [Candidatus Bathyarchaeota archaeon]|nr:50S ribosomal protein L30 [Candidatus Bathyarchaeota archaeon]
MTERPSCLAVIRVRGRSDIYHEVKATMELLHLLRNCHATLVDDRPAYVGMLKKAQHFLTWGETSQENIVLLLRKWGRLVGNKKVTDEYAKEIGYKSLEELAEAIHLAKVEFGKLPRIKPVFRLHPPSKGFRGNVKKSFTTGGVTGYRGENINDLIRRMT